MTPSKEAMEKARAITDDWFNKNIGYFDSAGNSLVKESDLEMLGEAIAAALDATKLRLPSEEEMLDANAKYMKANKSWRNTTDDLDHAYFHGQKDLIEDYLTAQPGVEDEK